MPVFRDLSKGTGGSAPELPTGFPFPRFSHANPRRTLPLRHISADNINVCPIQRRGRSSSECAFHQLEILRSVVYL